MSDFIKRPAQGGTSRLAQDVESSLARAKQATLETAGQYSPANPADWDPAVGPPTTIAEALDRLAAVAASPP